MKTKELDVVQVCKQFEDVVAPRLRLKPIERAVYWHLLRHSRLEGKRRLRFSLVWLGGHLGVTDTSARWAVRRLVAKKVLRLIERSTLGHVVEVRLPEEVRMPGAPETARSGAAKLPRGTRLDQVDFMATRALRQAIHFARGRQMFLLPAPDPQAVTLPGPRGAPSEIGAQFVPQPRFLLPGLQLAQRGPFGRRPSAPALARRAPDAARI